MADRPLHHVTVTGFVTDASARVLLVRVEQRGWEMPGGRVEPGEDPLAAVRREVAEETGCEIDVQRLVGVYACVTPPPMVLHLLRCRHVAGEPRARESRVPEAGWFDADEARRLVTNPPSAQRLADALADEDGVLYRAYRAEPHELVCERHYEASRRTSPRAASQ